MLNRFNSASSIRQPTAPSGALAKGSLGAPIGAAREVLPSPSAWGLKLMPWVTFALWAVLAYSLVAWGLVWFKPQDQKLQVHTLEAIDATLKPLDAAALSLALGGPAAQSAQGTVVQDLSALSAARMRLSGVIYAKPSAGTGMGTVAHGVGIHGDAQADTRGNTVGQNSQAMALLSVDDHAPKAFRLGQAIEPGLYVVAIEPRSVKLGPKPGGEATLSLSLPPVPGVVAP